MLLIIISSTCLGIYFDIVYRNGFLFKDLFVPNNSSTTIRPCDLISIYNGMYTVCSYDTHLSEQVSLIELETEQVQSMC